MIGIGTVLAVPVILACGALAVSVRLGADASWDLRNYHLYDAFAALRKLDGLDLAPAQRQSFNPPMMDLPFFFLRERLGGWPRLLNAALALPSVAAMLLAWSIGRQVVPDPTRTGQAALLLALLFGATGVAGLPTTGTGMSEMPAACFMLGGLLILLRSVPDASSAWPAIAAGLLLGTAVGFKPTQAIYGPAAAGALVLCGGGPMRRRAMAMIPLGLGAVAGALLIAGEWWWHLLRLTGSPFFPYLNNLFRSPLYPPISLADGRFLPHGLLPSLWQPFSWAVGPSRAASELPVRDPRLALTVVAALCCLIPARRPRGEVLARHRFLLAFCGIALVLWQRAFSILRYLAPIELLSGLVVLIALQRLRHLHPTLPAGALAALLLLCVGTTSYPDWGRVHPADAAPSVVPPPLPPDAMVLLLTDDPMSFVAAFVDPRVRFVGVSNNLLRFGLHSAFAATVARAVHAHAGPLWGLEVPGTPDPAAAVLAAYGLHRQGACVPIRTNLESDGLRLCRLSR